MADTRLSKELKQDIAGYLATGRSNTLSRGVPGGLLEAMDSYNRHLRDALLAEVQRRESARPVAHLPPDVRVKTIVRRKLRPMIDGLFSASERANVLSVAERSIVFLTRDVVHHLIREISYRESAWLIANIYLGSLGLPSMDGGTNAPLGCNEHTTCYVSLDYFHQQDPFADYVVHEVAHIFHNCKRETIGLPFTRRREWILDIDFAKRETFAFACEFYSRIVELAGSPADRRTLLARFKENPSIGEPILDPAELVDILNEAVNARNGWKRILARCSRKRASTEASAHPLIPTGACGKSSQSSQTGPPASNLIETKPEFGERQYAATS